MSWNRRVTDRRSSDRADAILVMSVLFVPFLFLVAGFAMDLTKAVYVKQQYQSMAQDASTAATRTINPNGSIASSAPQDIVNIYRDRFNGQDTSAVNAGNSDRFASEEGSYGVRNSVCKTVTLPNGQVRNAPYMEITISGGRNDVDSVNGTSLSPVYTSEAYGAPVQRTGTTYDPSKRYYKIQAVVWDTSPNLMLGMFGRPCQQLMSSVSAITFGSQADVYDYDAGQSAGAVCPSSNFRWTGINSLAWSVMENSNGYRITSTSTVGPAGTPVVVTTNSYVGTAVNRYDATRTYKLQARNTNTGGYVDCGTLQGELAPDPTCPATTFNWTANNAFTWNSITNADGYRISVASGATAGPFTTTATTFTNAALNRYDPSRTWRLEARNQLTGNYINCGTLAGQNAPAPVCPTSAFNYTGANTVTWNAVTNANGYRLSSSSPSVKGPFTTTGLTYTSTDFDRYDTSRTWLLEARNSTTGAYVNCGTVTGVSAPPPTCSPGTQPYWDDHTGIAWVNVPNAVAYRVTSSTKPGATGAPTYVTGSDYYYSNAVGNTGYDSSKPDSDMYAVGNTLTVQAQGATGAWVNCGSVTTTGPPVTCVPSWTADTPVPATGGAHRFTVNWTPRTGQPAGNTFYYVLSSPGRTTYTQPVVAESSGTSTNVTGNYVAGNVVTVELRVKNTNYGWDASCGTKTVTVPTPNICPSNISRSWTSTYVAKTGTYNYTSNFYWSANTGTAVTMRFSNIATIAKTASKSAGYAGPYVVSNWNTWTVTAIDASGNSQDCTFVNGAA